MMANPAQSYGPGKMDSNSDPILRHFGNEWHFHVVQGRRSLLVASTPGSRIRVRVFPKMHALFQ